MGRFLPRDEVKRQRIEIPAQAVLTTWPKPNTDSAGELPQVHQASHCVTQSRSLEVQ